MIGFLLDTITFMLVIGVIPVTYYSWRRLDDLLDQQARLKGTRQHPRALRLVGATVGAWLGYTAVVCLLVGQWFPALVLGVLWAILWASSAFSRRHGIAPWWYNVVSI